LLILTPLLSARKENFSIYLLHQNKEVFKNLGENQKYLKKNFFNNLLIKFISASHYSNIIGNSFGKIDDDKMHLRDKFFYNHKEFFEQIEKIPKEVIVKFDANEIKNFQKKFSFLARKRFGVIMSENNYSGHSRVKNWGWKNMQKVVDSTNKKIKWVQVGMRYDKKLEGTYLDLRDKTSIRELFYIVSKCKIIITTEGMLTHLSSAFDIPCITIFPGFLCPELSMYKNIIPVVHEPKMECSPCWKAICKFGENPPCLKRIAPEKVINEARKIIEKWKK